MRYTATINTPGYLPDSDEPPPVFDTAQEAWRYLADERLHAEDDVESEDSTSDTHYLLAQLGRAGTDQSDTGLTEIQEWADAGLAPDGTGTAYGPTPGYDGDHDLGIAYSVDIAEEPVHPHDPAMREWADANYEELWLLTNDDPED